MKLRVFYDGACHLCSREIDHYVKIDRDQLIQFIDISSPHFHAEKFGLDAKKVDLEIHVQTADGAQTFTGVQAFIELWKVLPGFSIPAKLASLPVVNPILKAGYFAFARIRPYLPKRKSDECESGTCYRKRA